MPRADSACVAVVLALATAAGSAGPPPTTAPPPTQEQSSSPFGFDGLGKSKEPINVTSDNLEYDYKANVVVYKGSVEVIQGPTKLTSDVLTVTMVNDKDKNGDSKSAGDKSGADKTGADKTGDKAAGQAADPPPPSAGDQKRGAQAQNGQQNDQGTGPDTSRVQNIVAVGNVRIDQGARWAVGGHAVFDQGQRTLVLTENPVLHDGPNVVAGDRVVVFLDENRSIVEGGRKRVKAVLYPNNNNGPDANTPAQAQPAAKPQTKTAAKTVPKTAPRTTQ
jgi:lipopolysaccharide export system protein LptA